MILTRSLLLIFLSGTLAACDGQVTDFVKSGGDIDRDNPADETGPVSSGAYLNLTPGAVRATSAAVKMEASLTPTRRVLTGGSVRAEVSLSRTAVRQ